MAVDRPASRWPGCCLGISGVARLSCLRQQSKSAKIWCRRLAKIQKWQRRDEGVAFQAWGRCLPRRQAVKSQRASCSKELRKGDCGGVEPQPPGSWAGAENSVTDKSRNHWMLESRVLASCEVGPELGKRCPWKVASDQHQMRMAEPWRRSAGVSSWPQRNSRRSRSMVSCWKKLGWISGQRST
jgi:hypothetical protein